MAEIFLRNTTDQVQTITVRESTTRRNHQVQVQARGVVDLDQYQVTPNVRKQVQKGIFKAFDEEGNKFTFSEDKVPEVPESPFDNPDVDPFEEQERKTEIHYDPEEAPAIDNEDNAQPNPDRDIVVDQPVETASKDIPDEPVDVEVLTEDQYDTEDELVHQGGGYYLLPNGEKVRGLEKAKKALEELKAQN